MVVVWVLGMYAVSTRPLAGKDAWKAPYRTEHLEPTDHTSFLSALHCSTSCCIPHLHETFY